jgi:cobalt/nickel transport system permease protein
MEKMFFSMLTLGVCLWANNILISALIILMMAWITVKKGGTPFSVFLKLMLLPISFLLLGVFTIACGISSRNGQFLISVSIFNFNIGIYKAGILIATKLFFKALASAACLYYLSLSTPMVDILSALRKLKCPELMIELMGLIYRFIFVFLETANTMLIAQDSRLGYSNISSSYRSLGALISTLFLKTYKKSEDLYTALEARGYEGELNVIERTFNNSFNGYFIPVIINVLLIITSILLM